MSFFFQPNGFFGAPQQHQYSQSPFGYGGYGYPQQPYQNPYYQQESSDDDSDDYYEQPQQFVRLPDGRLVYRNIPQQSQKQQQIEASCRKRQLQHEQEEEAERQRQIAIQRRQQQERAAHQEALEQQQQQRRQRQQPRQPNDFWGSLFGAPQQQQPKTQKSQPKTEQKPQPQTTKPKQPQPQPSQPTLQPIALTPKKSINTTRYLNNTISDKIKTTVCDEIEDETPVSESDFSLSDDDEYQQQSSADAPLIVDIEPQSQQQHHSKAIVPDKVLTGWESAPVVKKPTTITNAASSVPSQSTPVPTPQPIIAQVPIKVVEQQQTQTVKTKPQEPAVQQQPQQSPTPSPPTLSTPTATTPTPPTPITENTVASINDSHLEQLFAQTESLYQHRSAVTSKIKALGPVTPANTTRITMLQKSLKQIDALIEQTHKYTQELLDQDMY